MSVKIMYCCIGVVLYLIGSFFYLVNENLFKSKNVWKSIRKIFIPYEMSIENIWVIIGTTVVAYVLVIVIPVIYIPFAFLMTCFINVLLLKITDLDTGYWVKNRVFKKFKSSIKGIEIIDQKLLDKTLEEVADKIICLMSIIIFVVSVLLTISFVLDTTIITKCVLIGISVICSIKVFRSEFIGVWYNFFEQGTIKIVDIILEYTYPLTLMAFVIITFFISI